MRELGNHTVNRILESRVHSEWHKPSPDSKRQDILPIFIYVTFERPPPHSNVFSTHPTTLSPFFRELKEEWIKAKYVDKTYFCRRKCIDTVLPLDENILRAVGKVPGHHVGDAKSTRKKKLARRRPNLTSSIFKRFSKSDKKNCEQLKSREEKAAHNSSLTSPEMSPEIKRSSPSIALKSPKKSRLIINSMYAMSKKNPKDIGSIFTCLKAVSHCVRVFARIRRFSKTLPRADQPSQWRDFQLSKSISVPAQEYRINLNGAIHFRV